ncbi:MAG: hypothetical protein HW380_810 [Magnetococcales bacterium]|nr:hypothetical protein [Magnetococcales bacterium]
MSVQDDLIDVLIRDLRALRITLTVDGDQLRVGAPKNSMTPALHKQLTDQKWALLERLKQAESWPESSRASISSARQRIEYLKKSVRSQDNTVEFWPCPGDFWLYDEILYQAMTQDEVRNAVYRQAFQHLVKDKVVVDIGTGQDVVLGRMCIEAGAKRVYAIEVDAVACQEARACVAALGLEDRIHIVPGNALSAHLPELVDVSVSELIGVIGSSEGVAPVLNDARRFLKPGGVVIPLRCVTKVAAVRLPAALAERPHFATMADYYVKQIFRKVGASFDLRVAVRNFPKDHIVSTEAIFEELNFQDLMALEWQNRFSLQVTQPGRVDGLLSWIELSTMEGVTLNSLTQAISWLPVFFPVFDSGLEVLPGERLECVNQTVLSEDGVRPDYRIRGQVVRAFGESIAFEYDSLLYEKRFKNNEFYHRLFDSGPERR